MRYGKVIEERIKRGPTCEETLFSNIQGYSMQNTYF